MKIKIILEEIEEDEQSNKEVKNFEGELKLNTERKREQYEEYKNNIKESIEGMIEMVQMEKNETNPNTTFKRIMKERKEERKNT